MFSLFFNILLGQSCVGCKKIGTLLCPVCEELLPCSVEQRLPGNIITCLSYGDERVRKLVRILKFKSALSVAKPLGRILYERLLEDLGDSLIFSGANSGHDVSRRKLLLIPIPLSPSRLRERGYNQAELIARALIARDGGKNMDLGVRLLNKVRDTKRQVETKSRDERLLNLHGAFFADSEKVRGRHIILVDDVATTGATLAEGKRALLSAGAASVTSLALAH